MMSPRVSVVMANYNYGRYLRDAVESVLSQSFTDWELVIVDDGSTDDSQSILAQFAANPHIRVLNLNHVGQPQAKNAGIAAARGELIAFLDADDLWHCEKLERQVSLFDSHADVGVVYSRRTLIDEKGRECDFIQPPMHRGVVLSPMFRTNFVCFSSAIVRRTVFEHVGLFDRHIDLAIDYDLWLRVASHYEFDYVDLPLVQYRIGHGNLSRRVGERLKTVLLLMRRFLSSHGGSSRLDPNTMRESLAETYCNMGFALRPFRVSSSMHWFLRALTQQGNYAPAWRGLFNCAMPMRLRQILRPGRNWLSAYATSENDPDNR